MVNLDFALSGLTFYDILHSSMWYELLEWIFISNT